MQSSQPLVSVVIPCYNHEKFVQDSIQSVIDQTYENIELIIIDDGSKDNTVLKIQEMIELCKKRFTRFEFRSRSNMGLSTTLNEALKVSTGKYFSTIASDDMILPEKIAIQVEYLEKNENIIGVFGGVDLIDDKNKLVGSFLPSNRSVNFKKLYLGSCSIMAPTQLLRTEYVNMIGSNPYPPEVILEDKYMWLKLSEIGQLKNIKKKFAKYRIHDNNTMNNIELIAENNKYIIEIFKDSKYYNRAMNLANMEECFREGNKTSFLKYLSKHPMLLIDYLTYKKIMLSTYLNFRKNYRIKK